MRPDNDPKRGRRRILIAGGGASGVLLAVHLLRAETGAQVTLVERRPVLGAGVAYGTGHPAHLLNVRAAGMSAFPSDPDHFWHWIQDNQREPAGDGADVAAIDRQGFAPRRIYRDYLDSLLDPYRSRGDLEIVRGDAMRSTPGEDGVTLVLDDGRALRGDHLVLATGNEGPPLPPARWRRDGWTGDSAPPGPDSRVVIVGAGLTMVDQVQSLLHAGHTGPITAISRHGSTPHPHRPVTAVTVPREALEDTPGLSRRLRRLRALIADAQQQGQDWRGVIDGMRPHTAALWQGLSLDEKRRFLRHARSAWDIHRHRIAPQAHERLAQAEAAGQLRILAGRIQRFEPEADGVVVHYRPRGLQDTAVVDADVVYECRGRATRVAQTVNPLLRYLIDTGRVRPDDTGLGLDVTPDCALRSGAGEPSPVLSAVGPLTAGVFWESTAIPDIRVQAVALAQRLVAS